MLQESVLNEELKSFEYYVRKLPMFLQQSEGFIEHFKIWHDLLVSDSKINNGVVGFGDTLFNLLNIFDQKLNDDGSIDNKYLTYINSFEDSENGTKSDILDKLGSLMGVKRSFDIQYENEIGEQTSKYVVLDNHDFLILIKAQIIKNYCDGTYEQIKQYYESVGLKIFVTTSTEPATSNLYLAKFSELADYEPSENVKAMFLAGLLTIESMGINYRHSYVDLTRLLIWNDDDVEQDYGWGNYADNISDETGGVLVV